jgi:hypothetical protein
LSKISWSWLSGSFSNTQHHCVCGTAAFNVGNGELALVGTPFPENDVAWIEAKFGALHVIL